MWEILTKKEIIEFWKRSGWSSGRIAYAMSILLGRGVVERVVSGVYHVLDTTTWNPDNEQILIGWQKNNRIKQWQKNWDIYWQIITKLIDVHSPSGGVIGGEKSLELHLQNFSVPDTLIVYTRDRALRMKLYDGREVHFRTLVSGPKTGKKNLWRTIIDNSTEIYISPSLDQNNWNLTKIQICGKELALLEALSLRRHDAWVEEANIVRFLRSFALSIDRTLLGNLTRLRYIRPLNRLRVLARDLGYSDLYTMTLEIIRDEGGGCYLNL